MPNNLIKRKGRDSCARNRNSREFRHDFRTKIGYLATRTSIILGPWCGWISAACSASGSKATDANGRSQAAANGSMFRGEGEQPITSVFAPRIASAISPKAALFHTTR